MSGTDNGTIGYVVKRYPRYSETFIVSEILAHERAGTQVQIYALRPSFDTHFQEALAQVRAAVRYLVFDHVRTMDFWLQVTEAAREFQQAPGALLPGNGETPSEVLQGIALARAARSGGLDHLHAHFATSAAAVARIASALSGVPYTFTAHAKDIYHQSVDDGVFERKLADAAACVTVSDYNLAYLQQRFPAERGKLLRVYNGLDLSQLPCAMPARRPPVVLAVGRLVEKKGFSDLIAACALLHARRESFTCRIIGSGPCEAPLRQQIQAAGVSHCVQLVGPRPQSEIVREMQGAAALAAPCVVAGDGDRDGLPTVLLEAMALGTPCVATPVTGIPEAVVDGESGLLVPERDPVALAAALQRLLADETLRVRLATGARRRVESSFDIRRSAAQLREVFAGAGTAPARGRV